MSGGWEHTLLLSDTGDVYSCGGGYEDGRQKGIPPVLGYNNTSTDIQTTPKVIEALRDEEISDIACGWDHSLVCTKAGEVYVWGDGTNGKLGLGNDENQTIPVLVNTLKDIKIRCVYGSFEHSMALSDEGILYSWGCGKGGRLGNMNESNSNIPLPIKCLISKGIKILNCALGDSYNLVIKNNSNITVDEYLKLSNENRNNSILPKHKSSYFALNYDKFPYLYQESPVPIAYTLNDDLTIIQYVCYILGIISRSSSFYVSDQFHDLISYTPEILNNMNTSHLDCYYTNENNLPNAPYCISGSSETFQYLFQILNYELKINKEQTDTQWLIIIYSLRLLKNNLLLLKKSVSPTQFQDMTIFINGSSCLFIQSLKLLLHSNPTAGKKELQKYYSLYYEERASIIFNCFDLFYPTLNSKFVLFTQLQDIASYQMNLLASYIINLSNNQLISQLVMSIFSPININHNNSNKEIIQPTSTISVLHFKIILSFIVNQAISIFYYFIIFRRR